MAKCVGKKEAFKNKMNEQVLLPFARTDDKVVSFLPTELRRHLYICGTSGTENMHRPTLDPMDPTVGRRSPHYPLCDFEGMAQRPFARHHLSLCA